MKASPQDIRPEDCPEPYWHETHRYCPACMWTEDYGKPVKRPITIEMKVPEVDLTYLVDDARTIAIGIKHLLTDYIDDDGDLDTWTLESEPYELDEGTGIRLTLRGLSCHETVPDPIALSGRTSSSARPTDG